MAQGGEKAIKAALLANFAIAVMKFVGAMVSGSASMLAEFKHSVADSSNALFLLAGVRQSAKPADETFQFGYGKNAFFWSFVAAVAMLSIGGALSIYGGINKVMHPEEIESVGLNLGIIGGSVAFEMYSLFTALRGICEENGQPTTGLKVIPKAVSLLAEASPTTKFIFFEDMAALLGLFIAGFSLILAYETGNPIFDGIASILIGIMLLVIGFYTAKENKDSITGESADPELVHQVGDFVMTMPEVKDVHRIKSMRVGPNAFLFNLIVEGHKDLTLDRIDDINFNIKMQLEAKFPEIQYTHVTMIEEDKTDHWEAIVASLPAEK